MSRVIKKTTASGVSVLSIESVEIPAAASQALIDELKQQNHVLQETIEQLKREAKADAQHQYELGKQQADERYHEIYTLISNSLMAYDANLRNHAYTLTQKILTTLFGESSRFQMTEALLQRILPKYDNKSLVISISPIDESFLREVIPTLWDEYRIEVDSSVTSPGFKIRQDQTIDDIQLSSMINNLARLWEQH